MEQHEPTNAYGLHARVAVVTGAAGAIGSEIASVLAANGAKVALLDLPAAHASLQQRASALGGGAIALGCDVTNEASVMQAVAALERLERGLGAETAQRVDVNGLRLEEIGLH